MGKTPPDAAHGGKGWSPRTKSLREEMGGVWGKWGAAAEWAELGDVLLHRPGPEMEGIRDPDAAQLREVPDAGRMRRQHDALAAAYREAAVHVHYVEPDGETPLNTLFCGDLVFMTPEGAILARPASTVRAGEERLVARRLAALGVPVLMSVHGTGVHESADAMWIGDDTVMVGSGLRTNDEGARQVEWALRDIGAEVIRVELAAGAMHLMGSLRLAGPEIAVGQKGRTPEAAVRALEERGIRFLWAPDDAEVQRMGMNFVTLAPGRVLMPAGCPRSQAMYEEAGIGCVTVEIDELAKANGGIGCLTGVLRREQERGTWR
ncbi:MAG: dimethylarginine dimethylaminohydrolase family protein [Planctomycetota bacterium]|jgi:N-dimethylarginine dimethylaminohydrolase